MTALTARDRVRAVGGDSRCAVLDNGLRLVIRQDPGITGCAVAVNYRAGFRDEPTDRAGFAHLFEHLMFQGSESVPAGRHFGEIQAAGGTVNGNTFPDHADYQQSAPIAALDRILALEADRMGHLVITDQGLDVQRRVVTEEINLQLHGRAYGGFPWTVLPAALHREWAYAHNGFGTSAELDNATAADCADFYESFYAPANALVAVLADADPDELMRSATAHFAALPYRRPPDRNRPVEPAGAGASLVHHDPLAPRPATAIGWRLPDPRTEPARYAAMGTLSAVLTGGSHAVLRSALRPLDALADTAVGLFGPMMAMDPDLFVLVVHHDQDDGDRIEQLVDRVLAEVADGTHDDRVGAARSSALTGWYQKLDAPAFRVRCLARGELLFGNTDAVPDHLDRLARVTPTEIRAAAAALLADPGRGRVQLVSAVREQRRGMAS